MYDFGAKLRELRDKKKLTAPQVSARLGMHRSSLYGYENNTRTPTVEILKTLALFYGVTTDELLGLDKHKIIYADSLTDKQIALIEAQIDEFARLNDK